jgi:hypothetical protein
VLTIAALAAALAGCGGGDERAGALETELTITYLPRGVGGPSVTWELRCDPPGGSLPNAAGACEKLDELDADAFSGAQPDTACTQQYGGPQAAQVEGTFRGERVGATFSRVDGCQIARWDRLAFLFRPSGPK